MIIYKNCQNIKQNFGHYKSDYLPNLPFIYIPLIAKLFRYSAKITI